MDAETYEGTKLAGWRDAETVKAYRDGVLEVFGEGMADRVAAAWWLGCVVGTSLKVDLPPELSETLAKMSVLTDRELADGR